MAILKTFLCVCNTRTGSLICGCYTLVGLLRVTLLHGYVSHTINCNGNVNEMLLSYDYNLHVVIYLHVC